MLSIYTLHVCIHRHTWQRAKGKRINTEGKRIKTKRTSLHFWEPCQICLYLITSSLCICKRDIFFLFSFGFTLTCFIALVCCFLREPQLMSSVFYGSASQSQEKVPTSPWLEIRPARGSPRVHLAAPRVRPRRGVLPIRLLPMARCRPFCDLRAAPATPVRPRLGPRWLLLRPREGLV